MQKTRLSLLLAAAFGTLVATQPAQAVLNLTPAGVADGFHLDSFVTGFGQSVFGVGPLGMAVTNDGHVLVNAAGGDGVNYVFNNVNNQTVANHLGGTTAAFYPAAYAVSGGNVWGSTGFNGAQLTRLNNDGSVAATFDIPVWLGLWTNPANGRLLGQGPSGIVEVNVSNPNAPTFRVVAAAGCCDGVTVSPDGTVVYSTGTPSTGIQGYRISDGALVYDGPVIGGSDGMGIISGGPLNGDILANTNFGELWLIDPDDNSQTLIASGGTRGDYTAPDGKNGLFLTQSTEILRLSLESGTISGSVPEPSTWAMMVLGFVGLGYMGFRQRRRAIAA
jgi:hypothetical protein